MIFSDFFNFHVKCRLLKYLFIWSIESDFSEEDVNLHIRNNYFVVNIKSIL